MMIPRTLVPQDCRPPAGPPARPPRRLKTWLDERKLIPQDMPVVRFEGASTIPSHVPLDVLNNRVLIPRDMPVIPFPPELAARTEPVVTELDGRVVVPQTAHLAPDVEAEPFPEEVLRDLVETDVLLTGDVRLLPEKARRINWDFLAPAFSVVFHVLLIVLFLSLSHVVTQSRVTPIEEALNHRNLSYIYLPNNLKELPKPKPRPQKPSDKMRIDIGALRRLTEPKQLVSPQQGPAPRPVPHVVLPKPAPPVESAQAAPKQLPQPPAPKPKPKLQLEPVTPPKRHPLIAPLDMSPGRALEQSLRAAAQQAATPSMGFRDKIPPPQMPGGPGEPGGNGPGYLAGSVQLLTPTEGVDFTSYIQRLLAIVKRNWYAVMPEAAMLGDKGRVMLRFKILRNGDMPSGEPILELSSGEGPLDRAAMAAITASNPFEPLPRAYTRPYIELRFMFLYNLPLNGQ
jgi:TonB family protein